MRGARGFWDVAQVLQLIRIIPAVVFPVADVALVNAEPVLTGELILAAGGVEAVPLITVVTTVIVPVTPVLWDPVQLLERLTSLNLSPLPKWQVSHFNNKIANVINLSSPSTFTHPTNLQQ